MRVRPPHMPEAFYHVMLRGNRKQEIFGDDRDRSYLNRLVARSVHRYGSQVHAFCWMPNHLHLLVQVDQAPVHRCVHYFATLYAKYFNFRYELVGHVFQGRYKSRLVDSDGYLLQLLRYIHRNPVEGGLVERAEQYPWSSLRTYLGLDRFEWLTTACALSYFDNDARRMLRFVQAYQESFDPWADLDHRGYRRTEEPDVMGRTHTSPWRDLDDMIRAVCARHNTTLKDLQGPDTQRSLALARCSIGDTALRWDLATLSDVARLLNRSPAALSKSIRRNAERLKRLKVNERHQTAAEGLGKG